MQELRTIPGAVSDETSERGGVSPPILGRQPAWEEPGGADAAPLGKLSLCAA